MSTDDLFDAVKEWGKAHNINNPDRQALKMFEEAGELVSEFCRNRYHNDAVKDAIGDIQVVLVILADIVGYDVRECFESAYNEIKDRTGKSINGGFVKDE